MRWLLFLLPVLAAPLSAQLPAPDWQKAWDASTRLHSLGEATNGYLVLAGQTGSKTRGGTDGLFALLDHSTGQLTTEVRLGGNRDDVLYAAAQTFDGRFLLGGATASKGAGDHDAWLVLVDERGQVVWDTTFGTPGRDECRYLLALPDGAFVIGGEWNGRQQGDVWLARLEDRQLAWSKHLGAGEFATLAGLQPAADGGFALCGNTGKKAASGKGDVYLAKTTSQGELQWKKWFGEKDWEEALALTATADGGFAIAGLTKSKGAGDLDAWLLKTSADGFRQWDKTYGGKDADLAHTAVQQPDGTFLLAGATKSHRAGARFFDGFLVQTSAGGELQWEQHLGGEHDDALHAVRRLHDGSQVLLAAHGTDGPPTAVLHVTNAAAATPALAGMRDAVSLRLSEATLRTADGTLTPGQRSAVRFQLANEAGLDLPDVRVTARYAGTDVTVWTANYLGDLPRGRTLDVHVPVQAAPAFAGETARLAFEVSAGGKSLNKFEHDVPLRTVRPATLVLAGYRFIASGTSDEVTLQVVVENSGDVASGAAETRFQLPAGIRAAGGTSFPMGVVAAHSRREVNMRFVKTPQFAGAVAHFQCAVLEANVEKARKTLEWQAAQAAQSSVLSDGPLMIWTDPAPHETGSNKVRQTDGNFKFKMTVVSPEPVETKNIRVKVNGVEMDGSKFNEQDLSAPRRENTKFTYTYRNNIPLQQGLNRVEIVIDGHVSDALDVEFNPSRANLHILAIGPRHDDLQYTAKDAADFARAFRNQAGAGKLFEHVFVTELTTPEKTDLTTIKQAPFDLAYQWDDQLIKPSDLLVVFISSHGKIVENRFKILQTGYNPKYDRVAIDYKTDVLDVLGNINCKKLVFIDACHSGGAKEGYGGLSRAMVDLANAQPGVSTLTSCGSAEKSYEDKSWENGAFTRALLDAFAGTPARDAQGVFSADANGDRILRLGELYDFLRRRVPSLVQSTIPNAPTTQTPFMPESQLDKDLPIYYIDKQ